ncbi:MAG: phasin-related domain-containing protein [Spirochaetota bacterium]
MKNILQDIFKAGIGLSRITRENVEKVFNELKKKGEMKEEEREFFISRTMEQLEKRRKEATGKLLKSLNPNKERIDELNKKIDQLVREINTLKKEQKKPE